MLHADFQLAPRLQKAKGPSIRDPRQKYPITGTLLAGWLLAYSERGAAYIEELRTMIRINNLSQFNQTNLDLAL